MGYGIEEITFRPMEIQDVSQVYVIEKECFTIPWAESEFKGFQKEKNQFFFVAEAESIIGYGTIMTVLDECEVLRIAVKPSERRNGIGEKLFNKMLEEAKKRGARLFYLEVRESNKAAIGLYKKAGFMVSGRRKEYYTSPKEDAILMSLF